MKTRRGLEDLSVVKHGRAGEGKEKKNLNKRKRRRVGSPLPDRFEQIDTDKKTQGPEPKGKLCQLLVSLEVCTRT